MTRDGMGLQPVDDPDGLAEKPGPPAQKLARCGGEFGRHRNAYDGSGDYEVPVARHYVPDTGASEP